ncbi:MAG: tetratricopeptide repeat protein [Firmicutes bacterium]|nr:tetratricopeptide repeat protein [Bacillota bacterium]
MLKGFVLYYILSMLTHNPFLALIMLLVIYGVADRTYFGFLPDFSAPFKRRNRIKRLLAELAVNPANADNAQELGILYFDKKNYSLALKYLQKANEKVNNSARLYLYLGMTYMELNEPDKGKESLDKAVELDRKVGHGLPYIYLLRYELNQHGAASEKTTELEQGLSNFASTENFYRMGRAYKDQGNKQKAKEMFAHALEEYAYVPNRVRRIHRKWAILSRIGIMTG